MKVCINGIGNIGTTLALILNDYKSLLNIKQVICYKNTYQPWNQINLDILKRAGIKIILASEESLPSLLKGIDFVFDTTSNGIGLANKSFYLNQSNLLGAIAQGSEKGFGIPFMSGVNQNIDQHKFVQIVSCNTHAAASLLTLISGEKLENLNQADFVVVRRSEDLGNHERLVSANVVARHLSPTVGTHHAIDVQDMFKSMNINCKITSSDITTPSQLMHSTRFHIETKNEINLNELKQNINNNPFYASTEKFDSNHIFELGRRYGKYGRIFNHVIVVQNNLLTTKKTIKGWAFVPQEGNTIFSTIEAFAKITALKVKALDTLKKELLFPEW